MIEKILSGIPNRGPGLSLPGAADTSAMPTGCGKGAALHFPASRQKTEPPESLPPPNGHLAGHVAGHLPLWDAAKDAHYQGGSPQDRALALPPAFADYSMVHALIGGLIWSERKCIKSNIVHIVNRSGEVVAAVYPKNRTVAVRKRPGAAGPGTLSIKELPPSAGPFEGEQASHFETVTVHMLLWYFGQVVPEAIENLPSNLLGGKLLLRKLPLVATHALHVRHLQLIRLLSVGPARLQALLTRLKPEATGFICADLASLYLTGCLVSRETVERPVFTQTCV